MPQISDLTNEQLVTAAIVAFFVISLIGGAIWIFREKQRRPRIAVTSLASPPPPKIAEIARIEERIVFSGGGIFAVILLVLFNFIALFSFAQSTTILQETVAVLVWIGWNILCGIGAIIGRRRTYIVRREVPPNAEPE